MESSTYLVQMKGTSTHLAQVTGTYTASFFTVDQYLLVLQVLSVSYTVFSSFGVATNSLNLATFVQIGPTDGVTVSFLCLSVTDLGFSLVSLAGGVATILSMLEAKLRVRFQIDPYAVTVFCGTVSSMLYVVTVLNTTFLAVARCLCVARPLHFKHLVTTKVSVVFFLVFTTFSLVCFVPVLANMGMMDTADGATNKSRRTLVLSAQRPALNDAALFVSNLVLPISTEVITGACVVVLVNCLRSASASRQTLTGSSRTSAVESSKLTGKDLQVVKQVAFIACLYVVCNTPKTVIAIGTFAEPEFKLERKLKDIYITSVGIRTIFEIINASLNFVIYFHFNSKFRRLCFHQQQFFRRSNFQYIN
ncbi:uncharacterized protein LOC131941388 [Physella acuta]|uniref:uncharacterized protein LOC131941388 n=1 Tax=Physella acuta TaxID=109671 RepID=UPI0027DD79B7|nr:uncharacterized protein LOC131941388 [Physella acuta]